MRAAAARIGLAALLALPFAAGESVEALAQSPGGLRNATGEPADARPPALAAPNPQDEGQLVLSADGSSVTAATSATTRGASLAPPGPWCVAPDPSLAAHIDAQTLSPSRRHTAEGAMAAAIQQAFIDRLYDALSDGSAEIWVRPAPSGAAQSRPHTADEAIAQGYSALLLRRAWEELDDGSTILALP